MHVRNQRSLSLSAAVCVILLGLHSTSTASGELRYPLALSMDGMDVLGVVQQLKSTHKIPICFESPPLDPQTQGLFAKNSLERLLKIQDQRSLTESEFQALKTAEAVSKIDPNTIIGWDLPTSSLRLENFTLEELARSLQKAFPDFVAQVSNGTLIFVPKNSLLSVEVPHFAMEAANVEEVMKVLKPLLGATNITYVTVNRDNSSLKTTKLACEKMPLYVLLTRIVQATGNNVIWWVGGMKGSRALSIEDLKE